MFVSRSKYEKALREKKECQLAYVALRTEWDALVDQINAKGGQQFLDLDPQEQFTKEDINKLISLCHPDKHRGRKTATEMTQKLLELRCETV